MIIAVDGPSAAGKGTLARAIAAKLGYHFLDTGTLYRAVGFLMLRQGKPLDDEKAAAAIAAGLDPGKIRDEDLRNEAVAAAASKVSAYPEVRARLLDFQRSFARRKPGAVLDGRDIGTVVCPDADLKFFVTASLEERARRRFEELRSLGQHVKLETVMDEMIRRDERDASRTTAPTRPAADAILVDTSDLERDEVLGLVLDVIASQRKG